MFSGSTKEKGGCRQEASAQRARLPALWVVCSSALSFWPVSIQVQDENGVFMWEYRIVWPSRKPTWWDNVWKRAESSLTERGETAESRPDTYFVLPGRADVGIKLRGDNELEVKSMHTRNGNWELWEKSPFFKWSAAEAARFTNMLRLESSRIVHTSESNPLKGVQEILRRVGIESTTLQARKKRMQNYAIELLDGVPECVVDPYWLAEMVEILLPGRPDPIMSMCLETFDPFRGGLEPCSAEGGLRCGYPELLVRYLTRGL
jgi:hypothetical protein